MSVTIRISDEYKGLIDAVADQMGTSRKEVVDMILDWFFSQKAAGKSDESEESEEIDEE